MKRVIQTTVLLAAALALTGCGPAVRIFRGTTTTTQATTGTGGGSITTTTTGAVTFVYAGTDPNKYLFEIDSGAGGFDQAWSATANGTALTFAGGQTVTTTVSTQVTTTTLTGGTGNIDQSQLTLNLQGTFTSNAGGNTVSGTFSHSYAGTKE